MSKELFRKPEHGQIAGVAAGFADYFEIDPTVVRLLFIAAIFLTSGAAIPLYILLAVVLPVEGKNSASVSERLNDLTDSPSQGKARNWLGIGLVALGGWYLLSYFWPGWLSISWEVMLAVALVVIGAALIMRDRRE